MTDTRVLATLIGHAVSHDSYLATRVTKAGDNHSACGIKRPAPIIGPGLHQNREVKGGDPGACSTIKAFGPCAA